jgi:hypothetical protein
MRFALLLLLLLCPAAWAEDIRIPVKVIRVHDGDTIVADVLLPWNVTLSGESIRESSYDAWEIRRGRGGVVITEDELLAGKKATDDLTALFGTGAVFVGTDPKAKRDSFGRLLAKFWVYDPVNNKWIDVRQFMDARGHLRHDPEP